MSEPTYWHLVSAAVSYEFQGNEVQESVEFLTTADVETFPLQRVTSLRSTAAMAVFQRLADEHGKEETDKTFRVHGVLLQNFLPLGYMTSEEFYGTTESES
mgnify:CR=1 FL=1